MLILIDPNSGVPVYRQIVEQVRFQVTAGVAVAGDELPSTRVLSQELGVNPMTVSKAYVLLEDEGVVTRRPGLPLVVSARTPAVADAAKVAQLSSMLAAPAAAAQQIGISDDDAIEIFRQVLAGAAREAGMGV
jgi:GntR family transcriptional regulator